MKKLIHKLKDEFVGANCVRPRFERMTKRKKSINLIALIIIILNLFILNSEVKANSYSYEKAEETVQNFIYYLENGNTIIYNIIDNENMGLYQNITDYLYEDVEIEYDVKKIEKISENIYRLKGNIESQGKNWNANGFTVSFDVEQKYGSYKIVSTNLFDKIGVENVAKMVFSMVGVILLAVSFIFLIVIGITIMVVVIVVVATKKKTKNNKKNIND